MELYIGVNMGMSYAKVKSVAKKITPEGPELDKIVLHTMGRISKVVGATLGPGGRPVIIERQELNLPPIITKDGVTVFKSLGFQDPTEQVILEAARDAAVKTANEAGDGTTTATILAEAIVRYMNAHIKANPKSSPQAIVRLIESCFQKEIRPLLQSLAIRPNPNTDYGKKCLHSVARVSANGDSDLADAVMKCFELVGDEGNVTIIESSGPSGYHVEQIEGLPLSIGYEESAAKYFSGFINDQSQQRVFLENPIFILYHGTISDSQTFFDIMTKIFNAWQSDKGYPHNVVVVASGFSETVLAEMMVNFNMPEMLNTVPLVIPKSPILNGDRHFLEDIAAFTGSKIFNQIDNPLYKATLEDVGRPMTSLEIYRYRSQIIGEPDEVLVGERIDDMKILLSQAQSQLETSILQERIGKLSGGIAKLRVMGSSNGELREKRDRAEDAVCAVRGTIKHGCLPGGGWALLKIYKYLGNKYIGTPIVAILMNSVLEPVFRLLRNSGVLEDEIQPIIRKILDNINDTNIIYDAETGNMVDALNPDKMIVDSVPAVLDALKNSLSIATLLGTTGGVVVFGRDEELERREAEETNNFLRQAGESPELQTL
jgi:chaperonin GroEL